MSRKKFIKNTTLWYVFRKRFTKTEWVNERWRPQRTEGIRSCQIGRRLYQMETSDNLEYHRNGLSSKSRRRCGEPAQRSSGCMSDKTLNFCPLIGHGCMFEGIFTDKYRESRGFKCSQPRQIIVFISAGFIITSDHGEWLISPHNTWGHIYPLHEELIHVPLIIRIPGLEKTIFSKQILSRFVFI